MITVTGAHCFTRGGEIIFHRPVSAESVERVVEYLTHGADAYPVIFVCSDEMFITELNEDVDAVSRLLDIKMPTVRFFKADREPHFMTELMPDCTSMRWHPFFTDVIAGGVDKSVGIDKVLAYEGLSLDEAMAFGDGGNDVTMLSHVPYGIAMGNACDELKRVAAYVTDSVDEDGVEKALRHFGLID